MELKIIIKDEDINGINLALEAIKQSLRERKRHHIVETPHGYWSYDLERRDDGTSYLGNVQT